MIDDLKIAISEQDIQKARRIMIDELIEVNYPHEIFKGAIELADEYSIFEEHNKEKLNSNHKEWDIAYLESLKANLLNNFSKERFMTTYYVARRLDKERKYHELEDPHTGKFGDKYKELCLITKIGAVVVGVTAVGVGIWLCNRNKNK